MEVEMDSDNTMTDVTFDAQAILASIVSSRGRARERLIDIDQVEDAIKSHTRALELAARLAKEVEGYEELPTTVITYGLPGAYFKRSLPVCDQLMLYGKGVAFAGRKYAPRGDGWTMTTRLRVPKGAAGDLVKQWLADGETTGKLHAGHLVLG